ALHARRAAPGGLALRGGHRALVAPRHSGSAERGALRVCAPDRRRRPEQQVHDLVPAPAQPAAGPLASGRVAPGRRTRDRNGSPPTDRSAGGSSRARSLPWLTGSTRRLFPFAAPRRRLPSAHAIVVLEAVDAPALPVLRAIELATLARRD